jgi:hypothetical protein
MGKGSAVFSNFGFGVLLNYLWEFVKIKTEKIFLNFALGGGFLFFS